MITEVKSDYCNRLILMIHELLQIVLPFMNLMNKKIGISTLAEYRSMSGGERRRRRKNCFNAIFFQKLKNIKKCKNKTKTTRKKKINFHTFTDSDTLQSPLMIMKMKND